MGRPPTAPAPLLVLYDGSCGLCHWAVQFLLRHERGDGLRFAPLQGALAAAILARHGQRDPPVGAADALWAVEAWDTPAETATCGAAAARRTLAHGGPALRLLARFLAWAPAPWANWAYAQVARRRYRLFGRRASCVLPRPEHRHKFL